MSAVISNSQTLAGKPRSMDLFLLLVLLASLSLNVYLGWKLKQTKPGIQRITAKLSSGMAVKPVTAESVDGELRTISFEDSSRPTVLYVLSPSCIWCERNKDNIEKLAKLRGNDFRFVGLSIAEDGLKDYLENHHLSFPVFTKLTAETISSLGLGGTPQTIVISREGRVLKNWTGAYREQLQHEVEEYFQTRLPGLTASQ